MEKKELLEIALNAKLPYREILDIPITKKFGLEIEMEANEDDYLYIYNYNLKNRNWHNHKECSISKNGHELVSPPLINNHDTWELLKKIGIRMRCSDITFEDASFQINIDASLTEKDMLYFLKLYAVYESIIYRISKGKSKYLRELAKIYAISIRRLSLNYNIKTIKALIETKNYGVCLKRYINSKVNKDIFPNVIEFRTPNGTNDYWLWQNYINIFYHMIKVVEEQQIDYEKIDYLFALLNQLQVYRWYDILKDYEKLDIDKALDFANTIFTEDVDKIYFLKHYIGNDSYYVKKNMVK